MNSPLIGVRYKHLTAVRHKKSQVAAALGRELAGFVWSIGRLVKPHPPKADTMKS